MGFFLPGWQGMRQTEQLTSEAFARRPWLTTCTLTRCEMNLPLSSRMFALFALFGCSPPEPMAVAAPTTQVPTWRMASSDEWPVGFASVLDDRGIVPLDEGRYVIDVDAFKRAWDPSCCAYDARIVPGAHGRGTVMFSIRPGSIFERAGFRNGDVIVSVNGQRFRSPDDSNKLHELAQHADALEVVIVRRGFERSLQYELRRRR